MNRNAPPGSKLEHAIRRWTRFPSYFLYKYVLFLGSTSIWPKKWWVQPMTMWNRRTCASNPWPGGVYSSHLGDQLRAVAALQGTTTSVKEWQTDLRCHRSRPQFHHCKWVWPKIGYPQPNDLSTLSLPIKVVPISRHIHVVVVALNSCGFYKFREGDQLYWLGSRFCGWLKLGVGKKTRRNRKVSGWKSSDQWRVARCDSLWKDDPTFSPTVAAKFQNSECF
jgi:hypothetical protein